MQVCSYAPNSTIFMACSTKGFRGNQKASQTNKLVMFPFCSVAEWGQPVGESQALWLISTWSLPETDARSVCAYACVFVFMRVCCICTRIAGAEAASQSSDDIFIFLLPFFSLFPLPRSLLCVLEEQPVTRRAQCCRLAEDISLHMWGSGATVTLFGAQACMEEQREEKSWIMVGRHVTKGKQSGALYITHFIHKGNLMSSV